MFSPGNITREQFDEALGRYPALIQSLSNSKTAPSDIQGQLTLEQLDNYRFEVAPALYFKDNEPEAAPIPLSHEDVVQLVKWKLKHGTFRPNLLKHVDSNSEDDIKKVTLEAFEIYQKDESNVIKAVNKLTELKGIGPATASLLLSIHDAARVVFFSDEVYQWICHSGKKVQIKYTMKEYEELAASSRELIRRLGVDARDVEKVGFVLMKEAGDTNAVVKERSTKATEKALEKRTQKPEPVKPKQPTEMSEERKSQLVEVAAKGRAARIAKKQAKLAKGAKFRERVDAARAKKNSEPSSPQANVSTKRKSDVTTRGMESLSKRPKRGNA